MANGSNYFPHDYNCRTDDAIKALIRKHGMLGYGIWWAIVEDLYSNANALRLDCEGIAYDLHVDAAIVSSIINDFGLFVIDGDFFGSLGVQKRIDVRNEKSIKASISAKKRWGDANALPLHSEGNANKVNERKEKDRKKERKEELLARFETFWELYGKKNDKAKCITAFKYLKETEIDKLLEHVPKYVASTPDKQFRKNPLTYLHGKCWEDEITVQAKILPAGVVELQPKHFANRADYVDYCNKWGFKIVE